MTSPQTATAERAEQARPQAAPQVAETETYAPVALEASRLGPAQLLKLQRAAGNGAVSGLVQRAPPTGAPAKPPKRKGTRLPLRLEGLLPELVQGTPELVLNIGSELEARAEYWRLQRKSYDIFPGIAGVIMFARDVVLQFDGKGKLLTVETNLTTPATPGDADLPPPRFPLPPEDLVMVVEPATREWWQVYQIVWASTDETKGETMSNVVLEPARKRPQIPGSKMPPGQHVVVIYAPDNVASEEGGPLPKGAGGPEGVAGGEPPKPKAPEPSGPPKWAERQVDKVRRLLAAEAIEQQPQAEGEEPRGTGTGRSGTGPGGGGTDRQGTGTGLTGAGPGASDTSTGTGRGLRDRARPDKLVPWMGKRGPMVNVWKGGSAEAVPLKPGENPQDLKKRVEEAAARQQSTGKRIADSTAHTGKKGGEGNALRTEEEILEATAFNANATEYPSRIDMHGGSGAEVSPGGWGTTITGAFHNFDMILDWDARHFGLANQVFARLGWVDYFWQVIDVSKIEVEKPKGDFEQQEAYLKRMRKEARLGAKDEANVQSGKDLDTYLAKTRNEAIRQGEGMKEDSPDILTADTLVTWPAKAGALAVMGVSAVWNIGKALISAWVQKVTEPENRQEIEFGKPGEFLIRCLAVPHPDKDKPYDKQTRRGTSIAVFPVRVVDVNSRAREVTREDMTQLAQAQALLAATQKDLAADPDNKGLQVAVQIAQRAVGLQQTANAYSTVEKLGAELEDYDLQIEVLGQLALDRPMSTLKGRRLAVALDLKRDISLRFKRGPNGFVGWFDYEFHLHDVKEARKKKAAQKEIAEKKNAAVEEGTQLRPRVTFVSEENGALIRMDMILGREKGSIDYKPVWVLADVTTKDTARSYEGSSEKTGPEADAEAVTKAFEAFCEKAEYGRGTIAIVIPGRDDLINPGRTMLMKPGAIGRWRARLQALIEIAGMVAPYVKGGAMLGRIAAIGGALDAGARLYDRAVNDRLKANFETLADVVAVLGPMAHGAGALAEKLPQRGAGAYALQTFAKGANYANEFIMPATFVHDLDKIVRDQTLGGPEKQAAIAMLFGRGLRDGVVQYVKIAPRPGTAGTAVHEGGRPVPTEGGPVPTEGAPVPTEGGQVPTAPVAVGGGAGAGPAPSKKPVPRRSDIHDKIDVSDTPDVPDTPKTKPAPAETAPRPAQSEVAPTGHEVTQTGVDVARQRPGADPGAEPGGKPDTSRLAKNRDEQARRAAAWQVDAATIEHGTKPDARARARAAEFAPVYAQWGTLKPAGRQARIRDLINAHLAREGIPPVKVEFGAKPPGHAEFAPNQWTIRLSAEAVNAEHITPVDFATLVDNAVHETRHTVTTFRGIRVALATGLYNPAAGVHGKAVAQAIAANRRRPANQDLSEPAFKEALEIYQIQIEPQAPRGEEAAKQGVPDREAVYQTKDKATQLLADAKALYEFNVDELRRDPTNAELQRNVRESFADYQNKAQDQIRAHNEYVALPEEIDTHRIGASVKQAVLEHLALQSRLGDARRAKSEASAAQRAARRKGDAKGAADALERARLADADVRRTQADIAALTSKEPKLVEGRLVKHEVPLTEAEVGRAAPAPEPAGPARPSRPAQPGAADAPQGGPKPAESSPVPAPVLVATAAASVEPAKQDKWAGRVVGSDLPSQPVTPSLGTGTHYEPMPKDRFEILGPPGQGTTDSLVVFDKVAGKKKLFKPHEGEKVVPTAEARGIVKEQYSPRAKAAEEVATDLGLFTPGVELVNIGGKKGSLTDWIDKNTPAGSKVVSLADHLRPPDLIDDPNIDIKAHNELERLKKEDGWKDSWDDIQALDYLINNVDRFNNIGNYLIEFNANGKFKRLIAIDSELSFTTTKERAVIEKKTSFLDDLTYSAKMIERLNEIGRNRAAFADKLRPLVGDAAVEGVLHRLDQLIADANEKGPRPAQPPPPAAVP
jgi:hypothetical protein